MEVASLALGVVPLVLDILKNYRTLYRVCRRFKKCKNGVEQLLDCLEIHKVIFRNETQSLLTAALGHDEAVTMIKDLEHPLWRTPATTHTVDNFLSDSRNAITLAGNEVANNMRMLEDELKKIGATPEDQHSRQSKAWKKAMRERFEFAFSEAKLNTMVNAIAMSTSTYRTLRQQVHEIGTSQIHVKRQSTGPSSLQQYSTTQAVTRQLYKILAKACKLHTTHHAQFSLLPKCTTTCGAFTEMKVQVSYRHLAWQDIQKPHDVHWLMVESTMIDTVPLLSYAQLHPSGTQVDERKRPRSLSPVPFPKSFGAKATLKRVRIADSTHRSSSCTVTEAVIPSRPSQSTNLADTTDFCTKLRSCSQDNSMSGICIARMEDSTQWTHRVFPSKGPHREVLTDSARPLASLLAAIGHEAPIEVHLPILRRLHLAKLIAAATLSYHSTPLMQSSWRSSDIYLYNLDNYSNTDHHPLSQSEPDAFVEVPLQLQRCGNFLFEDLLGFEDFELPIRNPNLFALSIMLIELAYGKRMCDMIKPLDQKIGYPVWTKEYFAARRLSKEVSARLGITYSKIVDRCLYCDFGQGTDLGSPALQSAVQRDVIGELEGLISALSGIRLE